MGNEKSVAVANHLLPNKDQVYRTIFEKHSSANKVVTRENIEILFKPLNKISSIICSKKPNGFSESDFLDFLRSFNQTNTDEEQMLFYLKLISADETAKLKEADILSLINISCCASFLSITYPGCSKSKFFDAILFTLNKQCNSLEDYQRFFKRNLPNIFRDLHIHLSSCINEKSFNQKIDKNNCSLLQSIEASESLLSAEGFWIVYSFVPYSFIPTVASSLTSPMSQLVVQNSWYSLYQSNKDGLSLNRLTNILSNYKSPTLFFISFDKYLFCIGNDMEWRESKDKIGGPDAFALRFLPDYSLVLAGSDIIYYNFTNKSIPRGINIGSNPKTMIIKIDSDFSSIEYFGVKYQINAVEVWGCGGVKALENLEKQKQWDKKEILKNQNKKLNLENWQDSPDKLILGMAGIETSHNKRET